MLVQAVCSSYDKLAGTLPPGTAANQRRAEESTKRLSEALKEDVGSR